jgi:pyruvate dehydrogenase E2 component (dihydrolipoamide acetyltransferase)
MPPSIKPAELYVLGRRLLHVTGGAGDDAFVFVHGFGADHTTWMFALSAFVQRGRVYALDLPGHGGSDIDVGVGDIGFFNKLLLAYLDAVGVERAHLFGHSLGGAVATELALSCPDRVRALSLVAPAGLGPMINRDFIERFPELRDEAEAREILGLLVADPRMISEQMVRDVFAYVRRPGVGDALRTIVAANFPEGRQLRNYADRLSTLNVPVRLIWGAEDCIIRPLAGLDGRLPLDVVARAGHLAHMEAPMKVNRLLTAEPAVGVSAGPEGSRSAQLSEY